MRFHLVTLLTLISVASASTTFVTKEAKANAMELLGCSKAADSHRDFSTDKFLRVHNEDDEERAINFKSMFGVDKISSYLNKREFAKVLRKNSEDIDTVFAKLQLVTAGEKIFENPNFLIWAKYVDDYNVKHPGKAKSMLPTLTTQYGDKGLAKMLEAAKQVESTKSVATKLQSEQMKVWNKADISTDRLFKIYRLDHESNPFANPVIHILSRYSDEFFSSKKTALLDTLRVHYSDSELSQILIAARKVPSTKRMARKLEDELLRFWLSNLKSPDEVFRYLQLDKGANNLLDSMQLKTWLRYEDLFKFEAKTNPFVTKTTLVDSLTAHYNEIALSKILKSPTTDYGKKMATTIENELRTKAVKSLI
ncbi:RxLR effector candidate precursor [Phytophthora palmivora]|uniref:RxLR effector candidate n=1 Tax=Phytophthora palmivora TaxID=4796 RepID=A0A2P4YU03_9STRA|nr:RxLR effector candidate precursor [Phytophthora palmivora]